MANIAASDLTYSFKTRDKMYLGRRGFSARGTISFGDGALTYATGGVPLTKAKMGLPRVLRSVNIIEQNAKGYLIEYDVSAEKLRMFHNTPTGNVAAPTISVASAGANVAGNLIIGVNAVANASALVGSAAMVGITGVQAPAFTGDSIRGAELTAGSTAIQAVVLEVEAEGY